MDLRPCTLHNLRIIIEIVVLKLLYFFYTVTVLSPIDFTTAGEEEFLIFPRPSCPLLLQPKVINFPGSTKIAVCIAPMDTDITFWRSHPNFVGVHCLATSVCI